MIKKCTRCGNENYNPSDVCMHCALIIEKGGGEMKMKPEPCMGGERPEGPKPIHDIMPKMGPDCDKWHSWSHMMKAIDKAAHKMCSHISKEDIAACCGLTAETTGSTMPAQEIKEVAEVILKEEAAREERTIDPGFSIGPVDIGRHANPKHNLMLIGNLAGLIEKYHTPSDTGYKSMSMLGPEVERVCGNCDHWLKGHATTKDKIYTSPNAGDCSELGTITGSAFYCANFKENA